MIQSGDPLPDTALHLRQYLTDGPLLILFFTESDSPLCTHQLCAFRDDFDVIEALNAAVVAVSTDSAEEQARFRQEQRFPFRLLSDADRSAADAFGIQSPATKRAQRAAFVADARGVIQLAIPFYQPTNFDHYCQVFAALGLDL